MRKRWSPKLAVAQGTEHCSADLICVACPRDKKIQQLINVLEVAVWRVLALSEHQLLFNVAIQMRPETR
eukprot:2225410-Pyramimonas_sp.AAC.1